MKLIDTSQIATITIQDTLISLSVNKSILLYEMKKFLFFILISFSCCSLVYSQTGEHTDQYLIPPMEDSCFANPMDSFGWATFCPIGGIPSDSTLFIRDYSQPYYVDSTINVIGIASHWTYIELGDMIAYLCIADDTLGIIKRVPVYSEYDTIDGIIQSKDLSNHYTEIIFDSTIAVNGLFYIMTDMPKPPSYSPNNIYKWPDNNVYYYNDLIRRAYLTIIRFTSNSFNMGYMPDCLDTNFNALNRTLYFIKNNGEYFLKQPADDYFAKQPLYTYASLFPILQETEDSTITDSSSLLNIVDNYTFIFPNPANKEVNVQCSFRMQALELFNEQGQKVNEWKVDSYHYLLNVEDYPKGNYILKIKTKSGTATKKVIVQ